MCIIPKHSLTKKDGQLKNIQTVRTHLPTYHTGFPLKKPKDPLNLGKEEDKQSEVNSDLEDERSKRPREEDSGTESNADENMD